MSTNLLLVLELITGFRDNTGILRMIRLFCPLSDRSPINCLRQPILRASFPGLWNVILLIKQKSELQI